MGEGPARPGIRPRGLRRRFRGCGACIIAGSLAATALARCVVPPRRVVRAALVAACAGSASAALSESVPVSAAPLLVPSLGSVAFCFGVIMPAAVSGALRSVPDVADAATAVLGCLQMLGGAAAGRGRVRRPGGALFGPLGAVAAPAVMLA